jgi:hypothetical protein
MTWRVLYPIDDVTPHLPKDEILAACVKVLIYGGVDPRVFDMQMLADRTLRATNAARTMYYKRKKETERAGQRRNKDADER